MLETPNGALHADVAIFTAWCSDVSVARPSAHLRGEIVQQTVQSPELPARFGSLWLLRAIRGA